jgi:hypothetical protein
LVAPYVPSDQLFNNEVNVITEEKLLANDQYSVNYAAVPLVLSSNGSVVLQVSDSPHYGSGTNHPTKRVRAQALAPAPVTQEAIENWGTANPSLATNPYNIGSPELDEFSQLLSEHGGQGRNDYMSQRATTSTMASVVPSQLQSQLPQQYIFPPQSQPNWMAPTVRQVPTVAQPSHIFAPNARQGPMAHQPPTIAQASYYPQPPANFGHQQFVSPNHPSYPERLRQVRDRRH